MCLEWLVEQGSQETKQTLVNLRLTWQPAKVIGNDVILKRALVECAINFPEFAPLIGLPETPESEPFKNELRNGVQCLHVDRMVRVRQIDVEDLADLGSLAESAEFTTDVLRWSIHEFRAAHVGRKLSRRRTTSQRSAHSSNVQAQVRHRRSLPTVALHQVADLTELLAARRTSVEEASTTPPEWRFLLPVIFHPLHPLVKMASMSLDESKAPETPRTHHSGGIEAPVAETGPADFDISPKSVAGKAGKGSPVKAPSEAFLRRRKRGGGAAGPSDDLPLERKRRTPPFREAGFPTAGSYTWTWPAEKRPRPVPKAPCRLVSRQKMQALSGLSRPVNQMLATEPAEPGGRRQLAGRDKSPWETLPGRRYPPNLVLLGTVSSSEDA
ncbi:hypothetical protein KFL_005350020 [Klebsormidium nitens]|uniref:Uncharacterized protein n=1 Tax=Klebsormidium nitens TaxID=105231 RepID=A0A1Y1ILN6_KLENI|nr:hypothetical protein KFL_005350020 [Klebsormidium nitens]|eukprot:GAQ89547.1 hypothetical protein KFL_005350020 [Klebsormidium nitens]